MERSREAIEQFVYSECLFRGVNDPAVTFAVNDTKPDMTTVQVRSPDFGDTVFEIYVDLRHKDGIGGMKTDICKALEEGPFIEYVEVYGTTYAKHVDVSRLDLPCTNCVAFKDDGLCSSLPDCSPGEKPLDPTYIFREAKS